MKILFTGGGTGGHFYPLIAIAEAMNKLADEEKIINVKMYYMADSPYDTEALKSQYIHFIRISAGKLRVYPSFKNIIDAIKTFFGIFGALRKVFVLYPDVIVSKGGYPAFPVLCAARFFRIPVIIHESDTTPGRVNTWSGKFAVKVAIAFPEAAEYFDESKVSLVGYPMRRTTATAATEDPAKFFDLDASMPIIGVIGGSQGAKAVNDMIVALLPQLLEKYQIIHQTGALLYDEVLEDSHIVLQDNIRRSRYKVFPFLNELQMKMFGGASTIVISRSGSGLFDIAAWGKPSILIPYPIAHDDHQRKNAYHYARAGGCVVVEEANMNPSVVLNEIDTILGSRERYDTMAKHAKEFFKPDAARKIAIEALTIALSHEK
jgi:UDP-N-acetylglucosamine--N-acetylmuramyl-(pentapeptide) pyrophosphoryl-undecaprenol N-acetylglucosamine transferase